MLNRSRGGYTYCPRKAAGAVCVYIEQNTCIHIQMNYLLKYYQVRIFLVTLQFLAPECMKHIEQEDR